MQKQLTLPHIRDLKAESKRELSSSPFDQLDTNCFNNFTSHLSFKDTWSLARASYTLWGKSQHALGRKFLDQLRTLYAAHKLPANIALLIDVIDLSPELNKYPFQYEHLVHLFDVGVTHLSPLFFANPNSAWIIPTLCGLEEQMVSMFENRAKHIQFDMNDVIAVIAYSGNLALFKRYIAKFCQPFDQEKFDPECKFAQFAALGGQIAILEYLRDELKYSLDLNCLKFAFMGGHKNTIDFLLPPIDKITLATQKVIAYWAAEYGCWEYYDVFAKNQNLVADEESIQRIAKFAVKTNNTVLAYEMITLSEYEPSWLNDDVVLSGNSELFWHFIEKEWLSLDDTFNDGETIVHVFAKKGYIALLEEIILKTKSTDCVFKVDYDGNAPIHAAAKAGQWQFCSYLLKHFYHDQPLPVNKNAATIAHIAVSAGAIWFLRRLHRTHSELFQQKDCQNNTVLHYAQGTQNSELYVTIIEEFGIDARAMNDLNQMLIHCVAIQAYHNPEYWPAVAWLAENYGWDQMDIPDINDETVRSAITSDIAATYFPSGIPDKQITPL